MVMVGHNFRHIVRVAFIIMETFEQRLEGWRAGYGDSLGSNLQVEE